MLGYLKKFNNLPAELREKVSNQASMAAIENLEKKYQLPLAAFIMKVVVKEIALQDLVSFLVQENLTEISARQLAGELKEQVFFSLGDYLSPPVRQADPRTPAVAPLPQKMPTSAFNQLAQAARPSDQSSVKGASFFFSPDDEREIRELTEKIGLTEKIQLPVEKIEEKLRIIISRVQINFGSVDLADRFKQILKTCLRGVRNKLETELALVKPFSSGGLSFDEDSAREVMVIVNKVLNSKSDLFIDKTDEAIKLPPQIKIPRLEEGVGNKPLVVRDAPYDFSKLTKEKSSSNLTESRPEINRLQAEDVSHELAPLTPARLADSPRFASKAGAPVRQAAVSVKSKPEVSQAPEKKPLSARVENKFSVPEKKPDDISQMPLIRRRFEAENLSQSQKVRIEDVKYIPRVMSPLDELKYLDLVNFRRLSQNPLKAVDKIKGKISLLEEEGYGKRLEGIRFWRSSPINRMYLEIGHLSIGENKPVDVIIEERKTKVGDCLTAVEFEAIMDLNKSLRF